MIVERVSNVSFEQSSIGSRAIGRYEILRPLATGGMAEIFLGRIRGIEGFQKGVVIKRLRPELAADVRFVEMFLDEARLMATLQHSNIVQVFDVGSAGGAYFFSMELLRGEDLRGVVKQGRASGGLPIDHALFIVASALEGLHHAHERRGPDGRPLDIVHRDVSPSNIFVTYDGAVKVLDFGIAKTTVQTTQTRAGTLKGKIRYMSPEQCLGRPVDRRSDIFSASIVLWEITVGRKLFSGGSDFELMHRIIDEDAPAPSSLVPDYPPELERIVLRGLRRDPAERYATAEELQADIEHFARERRLVMSSRALGKWMGERFADKVAVWAAAEEKGEAFGEQILEIFDARQHTDPASVDSSSRPRPAAGAPPSSRRSLSAESAHVESVAAMTGPSASIPGTAVAHVLPAPARGRQMVAAGAVTLALAGGLAGWVLSGGSGAAVSGAASSSSTARGSIGSTGPLDASPPASGSAAGPDVSPASVAVSPASAAVAGANPAVAGAAGAPPVPSASASATVSADATAGAAPSKKGIVGGGRPLASSGAAAPPPSAATTSAKPPKWDLDSPVLPQ